ncbi:DUF1761 domain-containing protein [Nocardia sp. NPDC051030]|uniref:DUF1761 domain-containing protein n=1 Tax=Nocardia sp. NPDC051030 TaxID=3155162 RepID=UPI003425AB00
MILGILIATVITFIFSAVLYALPPVARLMQRASTPRPDLPLPVMMASVVLRSLVAACLVAGLMAAAGWHGAGSGALLGLALGVLPVTILSGAVVHESTPIPLAAVHSIDWIAKLVIIGAVVGLA